MLGKGRGSALLAVVIWCGCSEKPRAPAAPPPSGMPPYDEHQPIGEAASHESHAPNGQTGMTGALPPGHPAIEPAAEPPGGPTTPGNLPFDPKSAISGTIVAADKVRTHVALGDTLYLVARSADTPGPPLAVKRLTVGKLPMSFQLDGRDAMMAGTKMAGRVTVSARVDKDGDAMTKNPGDVTGQKTVELPADKIVLTLDTLL
jgi:hypothetical protein